MRTKFLRFYSIEITITRVDCNDFEIFPSLTQETTSSPYRVTDPFVFTDLKYKYLTFYFICHNVEL